jgi:hypothetical protein
VDSNKTRKTSPNGYEQTSSWRRLPTIDTNQYVALVVRNNVLKFHQDRTTNETPILDGSGYEKTQFFSLLSPGATALSFSPAFFLFFFCFSSFLLQPTPFCSSPYLRREKSSHLLMLQLYSPRKREKLDFSLLIFFLSNCGSLT